MTVGFPIDQGTINNTVGSLVVTLRDRLKDAERIHNLITSWNLAKLQSLGYTEEEATLLKNSLADLAALSRVATGRQALTGESDFFFNAGKLAGLN